MAPVTIKPEETIALVVGIEKYKINDNWNLKGPAHDACRFAHELRRRKVPIENIALFLSPLPCTNLDVPENMNYEDACENTIIYFLTETLRKKPYKALIIFWGGHGVGDIEDVRRVFYADAKEDNKSNLNINDLRSTLRTDLYNFKKQIFIFDVCTNFLETSGWYSRIPNRELAKGGGVRMGEYFGLFAAQLGGSAINLNEEKTGLFSKYFLENLENMDDGVWPPDIVKLQNDLGNLFEDLYAEGKYYQIPNFFKATDGKGSSVERHYPEENVKPSKPLLNIEEIEKIRQLTQRTWVANVFNKSIYKKNYKKLTLETDDGKVGHPFQLNMEVPFSPPKLLPETMLLREVYLNLESSLLILGEPGSGKTITLIKLLDELNEKLLDELGNQSDQRVNPLIPVLFKLSQWSLSHRTFADWLAFELTKFYGVKRNLAKDLIRQRQIIFLLDGLDEVGEKLKPCVEAINEFIDMFKPAGIVVTSRSNEYSELLEETGGLKLRLNGAIRLLPLPDEQVLEFINAHHLNLKPYIAENGPLAKMATNPLMLNVLSDTYAGKSSQELKNRFTTKSTDVPTKKVLKDYVNKNTSSQEPNTNFYPQENTLKWLSWLANHMNMCDKTIFFIEDLQFDWFEFRQPKWPIRMLVGFVIGFISAIFALFLAIIADPESRRMISAYSMMFNQSNLGPTWGIVFALSTLAVEPINWFRKRPMPTRVIAGLISGLSFGLVVGVSFLLSINSILFAIIFGLLFGGLSILGVRFLNRIGIVRYHALVMRILVGFLTWLIFAVAYAALLLTVYFGSLIISSKTIGTITTSVPTSYEIRNFFQTAVTFSLFAGLYVGLRPGKIRFTTRLRVFKIPLRILVIGGLVGITAGLIFGVINGANSFGVMVGLYVGLSVTFIIWALFGFTKTQSIEDKLLPNQGLWLSLRNILIGIFLVTVFLGLSTGIATFYGISPMAGLLGLLAGGVLSIVWGPYIGLFFGGRAVIQHLTLRILLFAYKYSPRNYAKFLDYCEEIGILNKVGGGYQFIHGKFQDYFADLYDENYKTNAQ